MSAGERTGFRSLVYSGWHRPSNVRRFVGACDAARLAMIDVDSCEYCACCLAPVALIETAQTVAAPKDARVTANLAALAQIPAYSVSYSGDVRREQCDTCGLRRERGDLHRFLVRRLTPRHATVAEMDPATYARFLLGLRARHRCGAPGAAL